MTITFDHRGDAHIDKIPGTVFDDNPRTAGAGRITSGNFRMEDADYHIPGLESEIIERIAVLRELRTRRDIRAAQEMERQYNRRLTAGREARDALVSIGFDSLIGMTDDQLANVGDRLANRFRNVDLKPEQF